MTGRDKITKLVADLRKEAATLKSKAGALIAFADVRIALAHELEATAKEKSDEQCEYAAQFIDGVVPPPIPKNLN